jgi:hypothetical protein
MSQVPVSIHFGNATMEKNEEDCSTCVSSHMSYCLTFRKLALFHRSLQNLINCKKNKSPIECFRPFAGSSAHAETSIEKHLHLKCPARLS